MEAETYKYIRNIAWDTLIKANANSLPTRITPVARLYKCQSLIDYTDSRYNNTLKVGRVILDFFKIDNSDINCNTLAVRILAPAIVLEKLNVETVDEVMQLTDLPFEQAHIRLERLVVLRSRGMFGLSKLERKVLLLFQDFIDNYSK